MAIDVSLMSMGKINVKTHDLSCAQALKRGPGKGKDSLVSIMQPWNSREV